MGRIFEVQAKNIDIFRRKKRRKLRKGDVIRIGKEASFSPIRIYMDLRPQTQDVLDTRKYANRLSIPGGIYNLLEIGFRPGGFGHSGILTDGGIFSPEASEVLARFPNPQSLIEQLCIAAFVDKEVAVGNWKYYDSFYHFGLADEENARTSWAGLKKTGSLEGGALHEPGVGIKFNGTTAYFDTKFNPAVEGATYQQNDARYGVFITANDEIPGDCVVSGDEGAIRNRLFPQDNYSVNSGNSPIVDFSTGLIVAGRNNANFSSLYFDGVDQGTNASVSTGLADQTISVGSRHIDGVYDSFWGGSISSFQAGSAVNFNHPLHYTHLTTLNTCILSSGISGNFPQPLEDFEKIAIDNFILAEGIAGNLGLYDEFYCFPFTNPDNALHGWFQRAEATNTNAIHKIGIGFEFNGTDAFLDSGYNPTVNGEKYTQDDAQAGTFITKSNTPPISSGIFGTPDLILALLEDPVNSRFIGRINTNINKTYNYFGGVFTDNSLFVQSRIGDNLNSIKIIKDGISGSSIDSPSTSLPNGSLKIGEEGGSASYFDGILSTFQIGASIGMNQQAHYDNLIQLLQDLSVFDNQVIARYTGLTSTEEAAIRAFVRAEVDNRNWFKIDEFFCFSLAGANALIGMKAKVATNNGAVAFSLEGAHFNGGTNYLKSGYTPSIDAINLSLQDGLMQFYVVQNNDTFSNLATFAGGRDSSNKIHLLCTSATSPKPAVNDNDTAIIYDMTKNNVLWGVRRIDGTGTSLLENGLQKGKTSTPATALTLRELYIGASNTTGAAGTEHMACAMPTWFIGAAINFQQDLHYQNHLQLLLDLDVFAKPVIDSFPNPLTVEEKDYIRSFINSQVVSGNWGKMDSFVHFGLYDPANALWDWKRRSAMTNNGAVHHAGIGYAFDGAENIDSLFRTDQGVNYKQDDALIGAFIKESLNSTSQVSLFGDGSTGTVITQKPSSSRIELFLNSTGRQNVTSIDGDRFNNNTLHVGTRSSASQTIYYENGVLKGGFNVTSTGVKATTIKIADGFANFKGTLSSFIAGSAIGFNQTSYYDELVTLNNHLRVQSIIQSFPNPLTPNEEDAVRDYLIAEASVGNLWKLDSLVLMNLLDPVNALWDVIRGVGLVNSGAVHSPGVGYTMSGIIGLNFNPTVDGINFKLEDALHGVFVVNEIGTDYNLYTEHGAEPYFRISPNGGVDRVRSGINTISNNGGRLEPRSLLTNDTLILSTRTAETTMPWYVNGQEFLGIAGGGASGLSNVVHDLQASGNLLSFSTIGAVIGYDHASGYSNLIVFNAVLEAEAVANSFPNPLVGEERNSIVTFVTEQYLEGNWQKIDSFSHFGMIDPVNALWDWKRKVTMTNNGAVHLAGVGMGFDGVDQYINSGFIPNDGVNYKLEDAMAGVFIVAKSSLDTTCYFGARDASTTSLCQLQLQAGGTLNYGIQSSGINPPIADINNQLVAATRTGNTSLDLYVNGSSAQSAGNTTGSTSVRPIAIGARNNQGTIERFTNGTLSSFIAGAAIDFSNTKYYSDLMELNAEFEAEGVIQSFP